jgi:hypothetical protein
LSSPPNHLGREGEEQPPHAHHRDHDHLPAQPAGTYRVVTEEEEIDGLSFVAFRRTATLLHLPALSMASATQQVVNVDSLEWTAIVEADGRN